MIEIARSFRCLLSVFFSKELIGQLGHTIMGHPSGQLYSLLQLTSSHHPGPLEHPTRARMMGQRTRRATILEFVGESSRFRQCLLQEEALHQEGEMEVGEE